ncbi:LysM peptidoglycan-binding domain-containing protein [Terrilactibacillus laevilacticus]|uniref:LysM peptidoglycan-binding domain-containing protein n=1 Tax=Terrilactibacillus laevilacticus TaxID=1380157 RepID=A0ABW5PU93_9BACI|nr:LysM domain-containing protein [Terrilactibacillus laevilacticus]
MKQLTFIGFIILLIWTSYTDLTSGTLSTPTSTAEAQSQQSSANESVKEQKLIYKTVQVSPGDTLLSISENLNPTTIPSIERVIQDFKKLNPDVSPTKLKPGQQYNFPIYK